MPAKSPTRNPKRNKAPRRDRELTYGSDTIVAGVDEVGRGAWAGPLVAAAVILGPDFRIRNIRDSKLMTAADRERVAKRIHDSAQGVGIGVVEIEEINKSGFAWALRQAGLRALENLSEKPGQVLLDGHHDYLAEQYSCETIVGGDATELCIAAASVVAKVHRDQLMTELHEQFPAYGFADHKGYGTPKHQAALREHGPTEVHRSQWKPIQKLLQQRLAV